MNNSLTTISSKSIKTEANLVENTKIAPKDAQDLVYLAEQIQRGDLCVKSNVTNKLSIIADQILFLQEQARSILEKANLEIELNHAACNILKKPGNTYYYYKRTSGQKYLSIMSPTDWGASCPHEFIAGYRLEYDNSWTPIDEIEKVDSRKALIEKVMNQKLALKDAI